MRHISNSEAEKAIASAKQKASNLGVAATIVVQDHGGHVVALSRMDGAFLGSIDIAERKARTSVFFKMETQFVWEAAKPGSAAPAIELTNGGLVMFAGGIPIYGDKDELIGAIGVSGG